MNATAPIAQRQLDEALSVSRDTFATLIVLITTTCSIRNHRDTVRDEGST